jgi:hypothetical protein
MNADFLDAHHRHMTDAETLFQAKRIANADQLYGFAAECGLKKLMGIFGMLVAADGSPTDKTDRVHAEKVWDRYEAYRFNALSGANYVLPSPNPPVIGTLHRDMPKALTLHFRAPKSIVLQRARWRLWSERLNWRGWHEYI